MKRLIGCMAVLCLVALTVGCGGSASSSTLAFVSNAGGNGFTVFTVNDNGTLTTASISPQAIGLQPKVLAITPDRKFAYFLDSAGNLHGFARAGNGVLTTEVSGSPIQLFSPGSSLAISHNSQFLYVALNLVSELEIFQIHSDGTLQSTTLLQTAAITQLAIAPVDGLALYGLAPDQSEVVSFTLDSTGATATPSLFPGAVGPNTPANGMILSADGKSLFVVSTQTDSFTTNGTVNNSPVQFIGASPRIYQFSTNKGNVEGNLLLSGVFHENADLSPRAQVPSATPMYPTNPVAGATSNDSRFLFIANQGTHNISAFDISGASPVEVSGTVATGGNGIPVSTASPFDCGTGCTTPDFIAVPKLNNAIYVLDPSGKIFQFAVFQDSGRLRALDPASVSTGSNPTWITIR